MHNKISEIKPRRGPEHTGLWVFLDFGETGLSHDYWGLLAIGRVRLMQMPKGKTGTLPKAGGKDGERVSSQELGFPGPR